MTRKKDSKENLVTTLLKKKKKSIETSPVQIQVPKKVTTEFIRGLCPSGKNWTNEDKWKERTYIVLGEIYKNTVVEGEPRFYFNTVILRKKVGCNYADILKVLIEKKVIEKVGEAVIGKWSAAYRLRGKYRKSGGRFVTLSDATTVKQYRKSELAYFESKLPVFEKHKGLVSCLYKDRLKIQESARTYLSDQYELSVGIVETMTKSLSKSQQQEIRESLALKFKVHQRNIDKINTPDADKNLPTFQPRGGRIHTSITTVRSDLREFLTIDGKSDLVYLDISNSQPFHMILLLKRSFWDEEERGKKDITLRKLDPEFIKIVKEKEKKRGMKEVCRPFLRCLPETLEPFETLLKSDYSELSDVYKFIFLVTSGKLYEFTSKEFKGKVENGDVLFKNRATTKKTMLTMFYSNPEVKESTSKNVFRAFTKEFPTMGQIAKLLKINAHRDFSLLLQSIEAEFVLKLICEPLFKKYPDMPLYTIHDGVITTPEYKKILEKKIRTVYRKQLGYEPDLKCTFLSPKNAQGSSLVRAEAAVSEALEHFQLSTQDFTLDEWLTWRKLEHAMMVKRGFEVPQYADFVDYSFLQ